MVFRASIVSRSSVYGVKELKTRLVFSEVGDTPQVMVGFAKVPAFDWAAIANVRRDSNRRDRNHRIPEICVSRDRVTESLVSRIFIAGRNWLYGFTDGDVVSFST